MVEALRIDPHNATRRGCYLIEGRAPIATLRAELGGFAAKEIEEQMQIFCEDVMPVLARECGGKVELPARGLDFTARIARQANHSPEEQRWQAKRARR